MIGWVLGGVALVVAGVSILVGASLPATRQGQAVRVLSAPPDVVRATLLDVTSQPRWRSGVTRVDGDATVWREFTRDGETLTFERVTLADDALALRFVSTRGYHGQWQARIEPVRGDDGRVQTRLHVTESATVPSPQRRLIARIVFDPAAVADLYLSELQAEVTQRAPDVAATRPSRQ